MIYLGRLVLAVALCGIAGLASAQIAGTGSNSGAPFRPNDWGMGLGGGSGVAPTPPVDPCTGKIDLSEGCVVNVSLLAGF